jgi:deazaflavin-dependent oxidoreductase (nitroreductase family)
VAGQPAGALRWLLRVPAVLYRWHAGWLLGHRFLLLRHTGRRSGAAYHTVLEVMHYDAASGAATCMSGWGTGADWYRNIMAGPAVVTIGRRTFPAVPHVLDHDRAAPVLAGYEQPVGAFVKWCLSGAGRGWLARWRNAAGLGFWRWRAVAGPGCGGLVLRLYLASKRAWRPDSLHPSLRRGRGCTRS